MARRGPHSQEWRLPDRSSRIQLTRLPAGSRRVKAPRYPPVLLETEWPRALRQRSTRQPGGQGMSGTSRPIDTYFASASYK